MAAPADIPLDKAYLTAIWLETMFFGASSSVQLILILSQTRFLLFVTGTGMNFVLFWTCLTSLTIRRRTPKINKLLVFIALLMFGFSTAHVSLGFQRLIEGFIHLRDEPGGPGAFFSDVSIPANVVKVGIHTVNVRSLLLQSSLHIKLTVVSSSPSLVIAWWYVSLRVACVSEGTHVFSLQVWRCWLVWGRDWKMCVLPILLIIASASMSFPSDASIPGI